MLATRRWDRTTQNPPTSVSDADLRSLRQLVTRRTPDLKHIAPSSTTMIEEAGTALLVTRSDALDLPLLLHARPGEVEIGVAEEPRFPLLSLVVSMRTPGEPRYAGLTLNIDDLAEIDRFRTIISQPSVDLVILDPQGRLAAACRFDLSLWTRARAHRALAQARRHLDSIPAARRSFDAARQELEAYFTTQMTA